MEYSFLHNVASLGIWLVIALWLYLAFTEASRFIQYDGKTKRGLRVGASQLSGDMERFLRHLSRDRFEGGTTAFIKKENQTVLIQPIPRFFYRGIGVWYVGYVDLSRENPRIEYRMPISIAVLIALFVAFPIGWIVNVPREEAIRPILLMVFMALWTPIAHTASKVKVRRFIKSMMSDFHG